MGLVVESAVCSYAFERLVVLFDHQTGPFQASAYNILMRCRLEILLEHPYEMKGTLFGNFGKSPYVQPPVKMFLDVVAYPRCGPAVQCASDHRI